MNRYAVIDNDEEKWCWDGKRHKLYKYHEGAEVWEPKPGNLHMLLKHSQSLRLRASYESPPAGIPVG